MAQQLGVLTAVPGDQGWLASIYMRANHSYTDKNNNMENT